MTWFCQTLKVGFYDQKQQQQKQQKQKHLQQQHWQHLIYQWPDFNLALKVSF